MPPALKGRVTERQIVRGSASCSCASPARCSRCRTPFVKLLTGIYPFQQVVWVRLAMHLVLMCVVFLPRNGLALLRTRSPVQQVICSAGLLGSTLFFFSSAKYVGVTEAIAISFVSPLAVTFLAWPLARRAHHLRAAGIGRDRLRRRDDRDPAGQLGLPMGLADDARERHLLRGLPDHRPAGRRRRFARDHGLLLRARLHAGDVVPGAGPLEDPGQLARPGDDGVARHLRRLRPLLRGARLQLRAGQPDRALELHADDRLGRGRLPDVRRDSRMSIPGSAAR